MVIDPTAIAQEVQYHPANSQDEALFLSAQALVIRELLKQAVYADPTLGESAWQADEETAISDLIDKTSNPPYLMKIAVASYSIATHNATSLHRC